MQPDSPRAERRTSSDRPWCIKGFPQRGMTYLVAGCAVNAWLKLVLPSSTREGCHASLPLRNSQKLSITSLVATNSHLQAGG